MKLRKKGRGRRAVSLLAFVLCAVVAVTSFSGVSAGVDEKELALSESAIRRSAVQCYALEGFYPDSLDYLVENYGLRLNEEKFVYHYESLGSNLLPQIAVFALEKK